MAQFSQGNGVSVTIDRETIPVTFERRTIDSQWRGHDSNGHEHAGNAMGATCIEVREDCYCSAIDEPHDVFVEWRCRQCNEVVEPGTHPPGWTTHIQGMTTVTVEVSDSHRESTFVLSNPELLDELRGVSGPAEAFAILDASDDATETWCVRRS